MCYYALSKAQLLHAHWGVSVQSLSSSPHTLAFWTNLDMTLCCGTWALSPGHHLTRLPNAILTFHCIKGAKMLWIESQLPYALKNNNTVFWIVLPENCSIKYVFMSSPDVTLSSCTILLPNHGTQNAVIVEDHLLSHRGNIFHWCKTFVNRANQPWDNRCCY